MSSLRRIEGRCEDLLDKLLEEQEKLEKIN